MITPEQQRRLKEALDKARTQVKEVSQQNERGLLIDDRIFIPINIGSQLNSSESIS